MQNNGNIETARNILNNAVKMNMSKEIILKISQKIDRYISEYYQTNDSGSDPELFGRRPPGLKYVSAIARGG